MMSELRTPIMTENIKLHFTSKTLRITKMEAQKIKKNTKSKKREVLSIIPQRK